MNSSRAAIRRRHKATPAPPRVWSNTSRAVRLRATTRYLTRSGSKTYSTIKSQVALLDAEFLPLESAEMVIACVPTQTLLATGYDTVTCTV